MNCNIELKFSNGESISLVSGMDSSKIPLEIDRKFMKLVLESKNLDSIIDSLKKSLSAGLTEEQLEGADVDNFGEHLIANTTAKEILKVYPNLKFPDGVDLSEIKVRLTKRFQSYSNVIVKKSANGEDVYLLDGNYETLKKFASHLKVLDNIERNVLNKLDKDSEEYKILELITEKANKHFKKVKINTSKDLLLHYLKNVGKYKSNNFGKVSYNGREYTARLLLDRILPKIEGIYSPRSDKYKGDPIIDAIYNEFTFKNGTPILSHTLLYSILSSNIEGFSKYFTSAKKFNEEMNTDEKSENVINFFEQKFGIEGVEDNTELNYTILFDAIFSKLRGFPYKFRSIYDGKIKFNSTYYTLGETYGMSYDTIILMDETKYRGWRIYEDDEGRFFISQYNAQPNTSGEAVESESAAKRKIDLKIAEQTFKSSFAIELFLKPYRSNSTFRVKLPSEFDTLKRGNIIRVPNISLPETFTFEDQRESIIKGAYTLEYFKEVLRNWPTELLELLFEDEDRKKLIPELNDVNKAGIFLVLLNSKKNPGERTVEDVSNILEKMRGKGFRYFYVEKVERNPKTKEKYVRLRNFGTENPDLEITVDFKKQNGYQYPMIAYWTKVSDALNKTFGTNFEALTLSEIKDLFGEKYASEKAFIIGNNVYFNTTLGSTEDLFHEYIHIIMGYLKIHKPLEYEKLLRLTWESTGNNDKRAIHTDYKGYSFEAKLEENFVRKFAEYIYDKDKLDEIFDSKEINETFETIFDNAEFGLKEAGKGKVNLILDRFSSEIQMALLNDNTLFSKTASSEEFRLNNRKTNLLKRWIKDGTLKELDC